MTDQLIIFVQNGVGRIRLNRPRALHALTTEMCAAMIDALLAWRHDENVSAVMLDHAASPDGDPKLSRGFCAGGDIAMIANSAKGDCSEAERFFHTEYRLNHLLFIYEKPVIAFIDGIVMGGGVGISDPARFRVATERTIYAMPETGIGLFPDVGGGWFLPRMPGRTGTWLATTGARINGADCAAIGIATHYMASEKLDAVKARIIADPDGIGEILDEMSDPPPPSPWEAQRADIDRLFAARRYEDILAALRADGSQWGADQLAVLATKSPQTIKVALRQMAEGAGFTDFAANMRNEYRIACHVIRRPDFIEGVRAVIFDKDNAPRWNPATPEEVTDTLLDSLFAPLPADREWTPLPELNTGV
ncbi:enoyl-CoA hydratase/isomerase family protein [Sphingomonadales bacterium 56]|uniref:enoyl-CoA hydratase/isomerase family protein n=1 Tax=unclassified Sphingobium TaxID=2611147 RepID=UPI0019190A13|nr:MULTISPECIES: enoyl-CoA hydratase/isomerase family protein [unclassified Sphingobium]MBY2929722.1 enoyl-CoA hydratase/isomerase family protein [Sphingomonadales bacterium 56]MBY2960095.1 enoyl-CoA hydratase/isomerase family protein [Sphingomonadales bacterium 58]CAD7340063.1 Carnitinyl-CoA dehydratase [Sphingobium sp. S6]CAD7340361.1 Carnitinyl-CoA dehydratase [Sphingobium sp. S8]